MPAWTQHMGGQGNNSDTKGECTKYHVETVGGAIYRFRLISTNLIYQKSTDGGRTWAKSVRVQAAGNCTSWALWYDRWSGIAAGLIHVVSNDLTNDDTNYRSIDTENSDTMSAEVVVFAGTSTADDSNLSITRARGGNLFVHTMIDAGAEGGFYGSTDVGATWGALTACEAIATRDGIILLPGWAADNQDIMGIFWDHSASEISRYVYDDSAGTWAETSIATSMTHIATSTSQTNYAAAVDITNSQNVLIAWTNSDTANADLRCWTVTEAAITEVTNVVLNSTDDQGMCAFSIDVNTGVWWAFYGGKSDGSETFPAVNIYYKVSADQGTTWGAETRISVEAWTTQALYCCPRFYNRPIISRLGSPTTSLVEFESIMLVGYPRAQSLLGV